jgi:NADH-quinone oxidoreductase subunit G
LDLVVAVKSFFTKVGCFNFYYFEEGNINNDFRYSYLLNTTLRNLVNSYNILLLGSNIRLEAPLLNSNIRKGYLNNNSLKVYSIGLNIDYLTYPVINLGSSMNVLYMFICGIVLANKYFLFDDYYNINYLNNKNIIISNIIIGSSIISRVDSNEIINLIFFLFKKSNMLLSQLNVLNRHLGRISISEFNLLNKTILKSKDFASKLTSFNYILGLDYIDNTLKNKCNVNVFQGSFYNDIVFQYVNLILPASIYIEQSSNYLNLEGRFRVSNRVVVKSNSIFVDYNIVQSLSILIKIFFSNNFSFFTNFSVVCNFFTNLYNFYIINIIYNRKSIILSTQSISNNFPISIFNLKLNNSIFNKLVYNFYNTDIFCNYSKVMKIMLYKTIDRNFKNNY